MARRDWQGAGALVALAAAACGGGGESSGPPKVATVTVTSSAPSVQVGWTVQLTTRALDGKGVELTGRPAAYVSSAPDVASVSSSGVVIGLAPGSTTITATVEGVSGTVAIGVVPRPVAAVLVSPRSLLLERGGTGTLEARPVDGSGAALDGRPVTWSSSDAAVATVSTEGSVTAVGSGLAYIRAESEGKRDSATVRVRGDAAPTVSAVTPALLVPGATATVTGTNFAATPAENAVLVNGVVAEVASASPTSLTFRVPAATDLPCTATGAVAVKVVVAGDTSAIAHPLQMATQRSLGVGESLILTDAGSIACNELAEGGGRYLLTVFNADTRPRERVAFRLVGDAGTTTAAGSATVAAAPSPPAAPAIAPGPRRARAIDPALLAESRRSATAHRAVRALDEEFVRTHRRPLPALRARRDGRAAAGVAASQAAALPQVGDMVTFRMRRQLNRYDLVDEVRFRAVYVGARIVIFEDSLAPLARTMDDTYQAMGREFDESMFPVLEHFGDPLAIDALTDANERVVALFSKRVNDFSAGLLAFVTACDFFPNTGPDPSQVCPTSNEGEYFYAAAPNPASTGFARDIPTWRRNMRGTLIHEVKHITANAERFARDADQLEESWLEEATAQQASEIWSREMYGRGWKGNVGWDEGPDCDYAAPDGACGDNAIGILHHFIWLYGFYESNEVRSPLNTGGDDGTIYGSAWSFVRWATDTYGGADERSFLRSLTQQSTTRGVANLTARTGRPFARLLAEWSLATLTDDIPGFAPRDAALAIPSWNSRDIFLGMSRHLQYSDGRPAFPREFPLRVRALSFGSFPESASLVSQLSGGSFAAFELAGAQSATQTIGVRTTAGATTAGKLGLAILRVE